MRPGTLIDAAADAVSSHKMTAIQIVLAMAGPLCSIGRPGRRACSRHAPDAATLKRGTPMWKRIGRMIFQGLVTVLPLAVTLYALWWLASGAEGLFDGPMKAALEKIGAHWYAPAGGWYVPGMGVAAGLAVLIVIGVLARLWITRKLLALSDRFFDRIPLAKTIYGSVKDLLSVFSSQKRSFANVAFVRIPGTPMKILGMVTREDFSDLPQVGPGHVSVYVPMSYQIGGFTVIVPKDNLEKVDMSVEDALRFAMTAAVSGERSDDDRPAGAGQEQDTEGPGKTGG